MLLVLFIGVGFDVYCCVEVLWLVGLVEFDVIDLFVFG